jgi:hypothetical protein
MLTGGDPFLGLPAGERQVCRQPSSRRRCRNNGDRGVNRTADRRPFPIFNVLRMLWVPGSRASAWPALVELGAALGVTRQAAQQHFGSAAQSNERSVELQNPNRRSLYETQGGSCQRSASMPPGSGLPPPHRTATGAPRSEDGAGRRGGHDQRDGRWRRDLLER